MKIENLSLIKNEKVKSKISKDNFKSLLKENLDELLKEISNQKLKPSKKDLSKAIDTKQSIKEKINEKDENILIKEIFSNLNTTSFHLDKKEIEEIKKTIIKKSISNPILKKITISKEFKSISSLNDLVKLSKKFQLNLLKIGLSKENLTSPKPQPTLKTNDILNSKHHSKINTSSSIKHLNKKKENQLSLQKLLNTKIELYPSVKNLNTKNKIHTSNQSPKNISLNNIKTTIINKEEKIIQTNETINKNTKSKKDNSNEIFQITQNHFEIKHRIISAKETFKHLNHSLKDALNDYKPPITKLSLELHPKDLGKIEITIKQRGDELQVQLNSNNQNAINFFSLNQQELKNNLINMGFTNINMNFNSNDQQQKKSPHQNKETKKIEKNEEEMNIEFNYQYA